MIGIYCVKDLNIKTWTFIEAEIITEYTGSLHRLKQLLIMGRNN